MRESCVVGGLAPFSRIRSRRAVVALAAFLLALPLVARAQDARPKRLPSVGDLEAGRVRYEAELGDWRWSDNALARRTQAGWQGLDPLTGDGVELAAEPDALDAHGPALAALEGWPIAPRARDHVLRHAQRGDGWILAEHAGAGFFHRAGSPARRFAPARLIHADPAGRRIAYKAGYELVVGDTETGETRAITTDGNEDRLYGELDWVYQEEVYGRGRWGALWWSPDGARLALLRLERAEVPRYPIVDWRGALATEIQRYPRAGEPNPRAALAVVDVGTGALAWVDLARYGPEVLVVDVAWRTRAGAAELLASVQDREQTTLELLAIDPVTLAHRVLVRETGGGAWVDRLPMPRELAGGGWLWESDRSGVRGLYVHGPDDAFRHALAPVGAPVRSIVAEDPLALYVLAGTTGATDQHLYRLPLDGSAAIRLTHEPGWHQPARSPDGRWWLDRHSSAHTVPVVRLRDAAGVVVRVLDTARLEGTHDFVLPTRLTLRARDGYALDASVVVPPGPAPARGWPVWISTYSGPDAPNVRDTWGVDPRDQVRAGMGIATLEVNVRSASGRGMSHTRACHRDLGARELADLEDAVDALARAMPIDRARVGITGGSYGGFITAYALTHSKAFRLGVAVSGVYDWRLYDSIYTERYMGRPATNPRGYAHSSCILAAGQLEGSLLLAHGLLDDNVRVENAIQLAAALQQAGKDFELALYPRSAHGIGDPAEHRDLSRRTWRLIRRELLGRE